MTNTAKSKSPAGIAIVTGGSRGIGAATTRALFDEGYGVCFSYKENAQAAEQLAAQLSEMAKSSPGLVAPIAQQADITDESNIIALFDACIDHFGKPTALVNNAGVVAAASTVADYSAARVRDMLATNIFGAIICSREAVRHMSSARGGQGGGIVNISSAAARLGSANEYVDYAASKGAIDTFTIGLAQEVATEGIRVNAVRPGLVETDIHASGGQPDRIARISPAIPMRRGGEPVEIAAAIKWLLSDQASYTTGAILDVAGGR